MAGCSLQGVLNLLWGHFSPFSATTEICDKTARCKTVNFVAFQPEPSLGLKAVFSAARTAGRVAGECPPGDFILMEMEWQEFEI